MHASTKVFFSSVALRGHELLFFNDANQIQYMTDINSALRIISCQYYVRTCDSYTSLQTISVLCLLYLS